MATKQICLSSVENLHQKKHLMLKFSKWTFVIYEHGGDQIKKKIWF